jgi:hypothetical protein
VPTVTHDSLGFVKGRIFGLYQGKWEMIDGVGIFYSQFLTLIKIVSSIPDRDQLYFMQISAKTVTAVGILSYIFLLI